MGVLDGPLPEPTKLPARPWIVLLVDDEPDILSSLKQILELSLQGIKVVTAPSGPAALQFMRSNAVDLVVSDYKMPGMDGIEFLIQAKSVKPWTPRIMLTAYPSDDLERRARIEAGVDAFLWKASDPDKIIGALAQTMAALQKRLKYDVPAMDPKVAERGRQR